MTAKDLKNALLQEAVQGKLVPQIASEGNAKDLLEEIRKEKAPLAEGQEQDTRLSAGGRRDGAHRPPVVRREGLSWRLAL